MSRIIKIVICALCVILCLPGCVNQIEDRNVSIDVSPNGQQVVFSSANGDLYLLDLKTSAVTQLTKTKSIESSPVFSPDGKTIAYSANDDQSSKLFTLSLADKNVSQITFDGNVNDYAPGYSNDGKSIVFTRSYRTRPYSMGGWTTDDYDACVVNSKGGTARRITRKNYYSQSRPQFLSKNVILYGAMLEYPETATCLFRAKISTGNPQNMTPTSIPVMDENVLGSDADVSPDGKKIVFISDRVESYAYDLYLMNSDGTRQTPLNITRFSHSNQNPVFMPDGKSILFLAGLTSNASARPILSLWKVNADGTNPYQIAGTELFSHPLTWKHSH